MKQGLAQSGGLEGLGGESLLRPGAVSWWDPQLRAPQDARQVHLAEWEDGTWATCSLIPEAC